MPDAVRTFLTVYAIASPTAIAAALILGRAIARQRAARERVPDTAAWFDARIAAERDPARQAAWRIARRAHADDDHIPTDLTQDGAEQ